MFQPIGFIQCQVTCPTSIRYCLTDERLSEVGGVHIADRARSRRYGYSFELLYILRFEVRVVER